MKTACMLVATALLLTGCTATRVQDHMDGMLGQPVSEAFAKLGLPDTEGTIVGLKYYAWSIQGSGSYAVHQTDTRYIYTPYGVSTYLYTVPLVAPYSYFCRLRIFVDPDETISNYDLKGENRGCSRFAAQLARAGAGPAGMPN